VIETLATWIASILVVALVAGFVWAVGYRLATGRWQYGPTKPGEDLISAILGILAIGGLMMLLGWFLRWLR
jgi:hypothetical protein